MEIVCTKLFRTWPEKATPKGGTLFSWQALITVNNRPMEGEQKVKTFDAELAEAFVAGQPVPAVEDPYNQQMSYKLQGKVRGGARPPQQQAPAPAQQGQPTAQQQAQPAYSNPASGNNDDAILVQCCFKGAVAVLCEKIRTVCDKDFTDKVNADAVLRLTAELFEGMKLVVADKRAERTAQAQPPQQDDIPF
jgi:hypothetical protein